MEKYDMKKLKQYKIFYLLETLSPLTHMMETAGNESMINREPVLYNKRVVYIPVLSGNSIRHRLLRQPGSFYLIDQMNIEGKMGIDQLNFMLYGGSLSETKTNTNLKKIANMENLFPLYRLLGGSLKNQIISGSLNVWRGLLLCEENRETMNKYLPDSYKIENKLLPAELFVGKYQYTRGDLKNIKSIYKKIENMELLDKRDKSNLMIYNGQQINRNSMFFGGFSTGYVSEIEIGCLFHCLQLWSENYRTLGGMIAKGHGLVNMYYFLEDNMDIGEYVKKYIEHVNKNKEKMVEWLNNTFPKKDNKKGLK
jgi:hypothetical protein